MTLTVLPELFLLPAAIGHSSFYALYTWVVADVGIVALFSPDVAEGRSLLTYLGFLTAEDKIENIKSSEQ